MLIFLCVAFACGDDPKDVVDVKFDPNSTYTMKATDVVSLISDSGVTRYRLNAKDWLVYGKAEDPYWFFPSGIYVEKFVEDHGMEYDSGPGIVNFFGMYLFDWIE